jgi:hypothetical protein
MRILFVFVLFLILGCSTAADQASVVIESTPMLNESKPFVISVYSTDEKCAAFIDSDEVLDSGNLFATCDSLIKRMASCQTTGLLFSTSHFDSVPLMLSAFAKENRTNDALYYLKVRSGSVEIAAGYVLNADLTVLRSTESIVVRDSKKDLTMVAKKFAWKQSFETVNLSSIYIVDKFLVPFCAFKRAKPRGSRVVLERYLHECNEEDLLGQRLFSGDETLTFEQLDYLLIFDLFQFAIEFEGSVIDVSFLNGCSLANTSFWRETGTDYCWGEHP